MRWLYRPIIALQVGLYRYTIRECEALWKSSVKTRMRMAGRIRSERRFQPEPRGAESSLRLAIASDVLPDASGLIHIRFQLIVVGS